MKVLRIFGFIISMLLAMLIALYMYYLYTPKLKVPDLPGSFQQHNMDIAGLNRNFFSYRPVNLPLNAPVFFVLHGSTQTASDMRQNVAFEFESLADRFGFIVVYPNGYDKHWNDCRASADYRANTENVDDIAFFRAMIKYFSNNDQADPNSIFVTGYSNGGHMAYKLAMETPELVKAIAPIAANMPVVTSLDCNKMGIAVSVAILNGRNDPINPYDGGSVEILGNTSRGSVLSTDATINYWLALAGKNQSETLAKKVFVHPEVDGNPETQVIETRWNNADFAIRLFDLKGAGHVVPSKLAHFPRILGSGAADVSGPQVITEFFLSQLKRGSRQPLKKLTEID